MLIAFGCSLAVAEDVHLPRDPIKIPPVGEVVRYETVASIPRQIQRGIAALDCRLNETVLREAPVLMFRPPKSTKPVVLATCDGIMLRSYVLWFGHSGSEPTVISLPVLRLPRGLSAMKSPGFMTWDSATNLLSAVSGNDLCGEDIYVVRHIYRYGTPDAPRRHYELWSSKMCSHLSKSILLKTTVVQTECGNSFGSRPT
jgi:hypothetical protein